MSRVGAHPPDLRWTSIDNPSTGPRGKLEKSLGHLAVSFTHPKKNVIKIGRPGYRITKVRDPITRQNGLLFQFQFPDITPGTIPRVRFMSAYEQKIEEPDPNYQYFIVAGEPYETVAVKLQAREVDRREGKFWTWFDDDNKEFWCQLLFKTERDERFSAVPGLAPGRK